MSYLLVAVIGVVVVVPSLLFAWLHVLCFHVIVILALAIKVPPDWFLPSLAHPFANHDVIAVVPFIVLFIVF